MNSLFNYIFGPLYLSSLADLRSHSTILLSKVSALFLLSHFSMVIHDKDAIRLVFSPLFFGDQNDIHSEWVRSVEKGLHLVPRNQLNKLQERYYFFLNCLCF